MQGILSAFSARSLTGSNVQVSRRSSAALKKSARGGYWEVLS